MAKKSICFLFLILAVTGCVTPNNVYKGTDATIVGVGDDFETSIKVSTQEKKGIVVDTWYLRAWVDKKSGEVTRQFIDNHVSKYDFIKDLSMTVLIDGQPRVFNPIKHDFDAQYIQGYGSQYWTFNLFEIDKETVDALASGDDEVVVRIKSESGQYDVPFSSIEAQALERGISEALKSIDAALQN